MSSTLDLNRATDEAQGLPAITTDAVASRFAADASAIAAEIAGVIAAVDPEQVAATAGELLHARRVFATGSGRSGLAVSTAAMRWMHLGLSVHRVGEVTAPAIEEGDLLVVVSGSGTTGSALAAADKAIGVGARVAAVTAVSMAPLVDLAHSTLVLPAATKQDHSGTASIQYAGSLFEQSVVVVLDALFHSTWQSSGLAAEDLWPRHTNLE
jgi:6-phospho-3-hexuloisomerase